MEKFHHFPFPPYKFFWTSPLPLPSLYHLKDYIALERLIEFTALFPKVVSSFTEIEIDDFHLGIWRTRVFHRIFSSWAIRMPTWPDCTETAAARNWVKYFLGNSCAGTTYYRRHTHLDLLTEKKWSRFCRWNRCVLRCAPTLEPASQCRPLKDKGRVYLSFFLPSPRMVLHLGAGNKCLLSGWMNGWTGGWLVLTIQLTPN